jgi:hypothetical protein
VFTGMVTTQLLGVLCASFDRLVVEKPSGPLLGLIVMSH